jgi:hypothetical protein
VVSCGTPNLAITAGMTFLDTVLEVACFLDATCSKYFSFYDLYFPAPSRFPRQEFAGSPAIEHFLCPMAGHVADCWV